MKLDAAPRGEEYLEYRAEIEGEPRMRARRRAVVVLFVVMTAFIMVDWIV